MEPQDLSKKPSPANELIAKPAKKQLAVSRAWFRRQEDGDELFDRVLNRMVQIDVRHRRRRRIIFLAVFIIVAALIAGGYALWKATLIEH